jgi:hypothetical protein
LWIAASLVYAVGIIANTAFSWPDVDGISHHPSFIYRMPEQAQAVLKKVGPKTLPELEKTLVAADKQGNATEAKRLANEILIRRKEPWSGDPLILEMPNGHKIEVAGDTQTQDSDLVGKEYVHVLNAELDNHRMTVLRNAFLAWVAPVLLLCLLGLVSRWVYGGFAAGRK